MLSPRRGGKPALPRKLPGAPAPAGTASMPAAATTTATRRRSSGRWSWWAALLFALLILGLGLERQQADALSIHHRRFHRRSVRLCSRSLSDALHLLCKDRGYNEPFSSSGETEVRHTTGPGLVEECCYNACSMEQMEQYCKPLAKPAQ